MRYKFFFLVFLVNCSFWPCINGEEMLKKNVLVSIKMSPANLVMGTDFFNNLDVNSVKEISLLTEGLIQKLEKRFSSAQTKGMQIEEMKYEVSKPLIADLIKKAKNQQAEYLIVGNIDLIELKKKKFEFEKGERRDSFYGRYIVTLRIVDVNSGNVIFADKITQTDIECIQDQRIGSELMFMNKLKDNMVKQLVVRILETLNPLKIVKTSSGYAYLENHENLKIKPEMKIGVYIPSRPSLDKNTGEIMGDMEYLIGELKVIEVLPKEVKTQIIKYSRPLEVGMICRIIMETENKSCPR